MCPYFNSCGSLQFALLLFKTSILCLQGATKLKKQPILLCICTPGCTQEVAVHSIWLEETIR